VLQEHFKSFLVSDQLPGVPHFLISMSQKNGHSSVENIDFQRSYITFCETSKLKKLGHPVCQCAKIVNSIKLCHVLKCNVFVVILCIYQIYVFYTSDPLNDILHLILLII